jgi:hypothetical protein
MFQQLAHTIKERYETWLTSQMHGAQATSGHEAHLTPGQALVHRAVSRRALDSSFGKTHAHFAHLMPYCCRCQRADASLPPCPLEDAAAALPCLRGSMKEGQFYL